MRRLEAACGREGGRSGRLAFALAVFLTRPQAEHQIGARADYPKPCARARAIMGRIRNITVTDRTELILRRRMPLGLHGGIFFCLLAVGVQIVPINSRPRSRAALARAADARLQVVVVSVGLLSGLALLISVGAVWLPAS